MQQEKIYLFVFPGLGKTTLCHKEGGFYDADWGYFRASFGESESTIRGYCKIANINAKEGFIVLVNEPSLMPRIKQQATSILCVIPRDDSNVGDRVLERERIKPVNKKFATDYAANWRQWKEGWRKMANRLSIPVVEINGLTEDWREVKNALQNSKL